MPNVTVWDEANDRESFAFAFALLPLAGQPICPFVETGIQLGVTGTIGDSQRSDSEFWKMRTSYLRSHSVKPNLKIFALICFAISVATPSFGQDSGADVFKAKCQVCHGADGLGATPIGKSLSIVSFKDPTVVKLSNTAMAGVIKSGKNKMPSFEGKLTDAQISAVVAYIRALQK
jgi:cytochrome c6